MSLFNRIFARPVAAEHWRKEAARLEKALGAARQEARDSADRNIHYTEALLNIAAQKTPKANATVCRMAKIARDAIFSVA